MLQVFSQQSRGPGLDRRLDDQGVPIGQARCQAPTDGRPYQPAMKLADTQGAQCVHGLERLIGGKRPGEFARDSHVELAQYLWTQYVVLGVSLEQFP